jgi:hypothetical protein
MLSLRYAMLFALAPLVACNDGGPTESGPAVGTEVMSISPNQVEMQVGELVALRISGVSTQLLATWTSENPEIASVLAGGFVNGLQPGRTIVTAYVGSQSASVPVIVYGRPEAK